MKYLKLIPQIVKIVIKYTPLIFAIAEALDKLGAEYESIKSKES